MDATRARLQLRIIRTTVRAESGRLAPVMMDAVRKRAVAILDRLEAEAENDSELLNEIAETRREVG